MKLKLIKNEKREKKTKSPSSYHLIDTTNNLNSFSHLSCLKSKENIFGIKIDIQCSIHSVPKKSRRLLRAYRITKNKPKDPNKHRFENGY